jgi:hypothetical protein
MQAPATALSRLRAPTLGEVAAYDMKLAATLIESGRVAKRVDALGNPELDYAINTRGWQLVNLVARWESGTADDTIEARLVENICADLWVCSVRTTVRRPLFASGSLWKAQSDYFNSLNSGIDFTLITKNNCYDLAISPDPTPLDNIREVFGESCPFGIVLTCGATFDSWFTYTRSLTEAGVIPMEAIVTFSGIRLKSGCYKRFTTAEAEALVKQAMSME